MQVLHISELPKFTSFPKEMDDLRSLQTLEMLKCPNFLSLTEWMGGLASLQTLYILECPKLISLPEGMCGLTTMEILIIFGCPILVQRCHENSGEEWPKIAHIQHLLGDLNRQGSNAGISLSLSSMPILDRKSITYYLCIHLVHVSLLVFTIFIGD